MHAYKFPFSKQSFKVVPTSFTAEKNTTSES